MDRWVFIIIQGILLGLIIVFELFNWISEKFVQWENYARKSEHENHYLDAYIQFSYVMMFTVVWPLVAVPAATRFVSGVQTDGPCRAGTLPLASGSPCSRTPIKLASRSSRHLQGYVISFGTIQASNTTDPRACVNKSVDKTPAVLRRSVYQRLKQIQHLTVTQAASPAQLAYVERLRVVFDTYDRDGDGRVFVAELVKVLAAWLCKHSSELLSYAGMIFRYMDKPKIGKVPFATCCLTMQFLNQ
ncbi:hypothetical protein PsorP6_007937 [Peronosclerospora sorghi]|uniref:Uncharacterized protein n=1 Tax=Peronosclerospora sorghi TaxID=230839 RepID=A0ACC0WA73_9STRA|nr:hypothetical protein PsorP6_007937 [Peronosclerospora sorghi]